MARLLAIDFDRIEARYVLASPKGRRLKIHAAGSVPLPENTPEEEQSPSSSGELLRTALSEQGLRPAASLVGVDRTGIELLHLTLPPGTAPEVIWKPPVLVMLGAPLDEMAATQPAIEVVEAVQ